MINFKEYASSRFVELNESSKKLNVQLIKQIEKTLTSINFCFLNVEYKLNTDTGVLSILHEGGKRIVKEKLNSLPNTLKNAKNDELQKELLKILQSQVTLKNVEVISKGGEDTAFMLSFNLYGIECIVTLRDNGGVLNVNTKDKSSEKRFINISKDSKLYEVKEYYLLKNKIEDKHKAIIENCVIELLNKFH